MEHGARCVVCGEPVHFHATKCPHCHTTWTYSNIGQDPRPGTSAIFGGCAGAVAILMLAAVSLPILPILAIGAVVFFIVKSFVYSQMSGTNDQTPDDWD